MSKVLFIVGSLRQGSFNHQLAQEAEKALAGKADVSYLDWSQVPSLAKIWNNQRLQLLLRSAKKSKLQTLSGFSHQFTTSLFLVQ